MKFPTLGDLVEILYSITNLKSEQRGGLILNLFDALNPLVASVCP